MLQLGLLEETAHSAVETATARVDVGLDLRVDDAEIDQILQTALSTGKLVVANCQLPVATVCDHSSRAFACNCLRDK